MNENHLAVFVCPKTRPIVPKKSSGQIQNLFETERFFTSGVLVIDYKNQLHDGDFAPNPACYPSVKALASGIKEKINATLMFSFWPEVIASSPEYPVLKAHGN
jgi:hypothetical protein